MFHLFNNQCVENNSVKEINRNLLEVTLKNFPPLNTAELEMRHSLAFAMLEKLDVENTEFDAEYNRIIAGTIIYALSFETTKYNHTMHGSLYPLYIPQLFDKCQITDSKLYYEELILVLAKKALEDKVIPFDENIINQYFGCFHGNEINSLRDILLSRFATTQKKHLENDAVAESEHNYRCDGCRLF